MNKEKQIQAYASQFVNHYRKNYMHHEAVRVVTRETRAQPLDLNSLTGNQLQARRGSSENDAERYMDSPCLREKDPLIAWKKLETEFPALALMARDVLAVPISGVGVERIFNMARDVCGYRRGQLSHESFRQQMLIKYHDRHHMRLQSDADDDSAGTPTEPTDNLTRTDLHGDSDLGEDRIEDPDIYEIGDVDDDVVDGRGFVIDATGHLVGPTRNNYTMVEHESVETSEEEGGGSGALEDI